VKRRWIYARQAYTPRLWPALLAIAPVAAILAFILQPPMWALIPGAAFLGLAASQVQWWWWRHRHPILPPQIIARRRAMWN
jgi:hypothetical protein